MLVHIKYAGPHVRGHHVIEHHLSAHHVSVHHVMDIMLENIMVMTVQDSLEQCRDSVGHCRTLSIKSVDIAGTVHSIA